MIPVITTSTGRVTRSLKKNLEAIPGKYYERQLYLEHNTEKYYNLNLEAWAVEIPTGLR
jgi:hypothetical protein